jgi:two-component system LytT family sensor kinase
MNTMAMKQGRNKLKPYLGFDDIWVLLIGIPIIAFLVPLIFFRATLANGFLDYWPRFAVSLIFTFSYWMTVRGICIYIRRRMPAFHQVRRRLAYTLMAVLGLFFAINIPLDIVHIWIFPREPQQDMTPFDYHAASLMIILLVLAIYEGIFLYARWKESILEQERLRREHIQSQLEGLKNQVNPHFLFNSLNTLAQLIPESPERAIQFVQKLSAVYRYILEIKDSKLIDLEEELRFLRSYLFLLKERFGDNIRLEINEVEAWRHHQIVPLSLQILIENAIKHNIISSERPLLIKLFADERGGLIVRNNLQRKRQAMYSTQVGLRNIKNRYAFFTLDPVEVYDDGLSFSVRLPLLSGPVPVNAV